MDDLAHHFTQNIYKEITEVQLDKLFKPDALGNQGPSCTSHQNKQMMPVAKMWIRADILD
jgi:hypothetical protein